VSVVRVALAEDDYNYRSSLESLLTLDESFTLVASHESALPLLERAETARRWGVPPEWDVVLMDIELPGMDGIEAVARLKGLWPDLRVVMLTAFEDPGRILRAICSGADGYLLKKASVDEVLDELRGVLAGGSPLTPAVARAVMAHVRATSPAAAEASPSSMAAKASAEARLSERELEVLRGLVAGLGYAGVADRLHLSVDTVRTYVRRIYQKLHVHSAAEAAAKAVRQKLV
jgi:DNA-binding NarL/FixJ family response regulator